MISHSKPFISSAEKKAVQDVLDSGMIGSGKLTTELEQMIATDIGYAVCIAVSSASLGIYSILRHKFPAGGAKVALASYVCRSVWDAIKMADCMPLLYDIDPATLAIDISKIRSENTDAVIVAHMFGIRADFEKLNDSGIEIIEDCAQRVVPTTIKNEPRAKWRVYSFEPTKLLTSAQGGVIAGTDKEDTELLRKKLSGEYDIDADCIKAPYTDLQAGMACIQWKSLDSFLSTRRSIASYYIDRLTQAGLRKIIHPSMFAEDCWHFRFILQVTSPEMLIEKMEEKEVVCRKPINPFGLHKLFDVQGDFQQTENATNHLLSLPLYPALEKTEQEKVMSSFIDIYE